MNPKTAYSYKIVALFGTLQSAKPVTVKATTTAFTAPKLTKAIAGDIGLTSVTLCWQVHPDATSFDVKVLQNKNSVPLTFGAGGNAAWVENTSGKIVGVTITRLDPGKKYDFEVRGLSSVVSTPSAVAKTAVTTLKFPAAPTPAVVRNSITSNSVQLSWKATALPMGIPGTVYYEIYYTETKGLKPGAAGWTRISTPGSAITAPITGLGAGKTYYFYLRSIWSIEENVFSNSGVLTVKMKAL